MTRTDPETLLRETFAAIRTDPRFDVAPRPDAVSRVRSGAQARRRRTATATAMAGVATFGAVGIATVNLDGTGDTAGLAAGTRLAGQPDPSRTPVPGITPAFTPTHGTEWLLLPTPAAQFAATHVTPSPSAQRVPSPAPPGESSARLLADVQRALPDGTTYEREDALGGVADHPAVHATLPDGTPVEIRREHEPVPISVAGRMHDGGDSASFSLTGVPDSTYAILSGGPVGYGWPGDTPPDANLVVVVDETGEATTWLAPLTVSLETLRGWALAATRS